MSRHPSNGNLRSTVELLSGAEWRTEKSGLTSFPDRLLRMKKQLIRALALLVMVTAIVAWAGAGANRGWTKTTVPVKTVDEVTGIEAITYEKRFLPGVDFLAGGVAASVGLFGISFLFRKQVAKTSA